MSGFINPYNFIKLPAEKQKAYEESDSHTGVIEYTITTKSPLFIPNTSSDNAFLTYTKQDENEKKQHRSYDFYSYTELNPEKNYKDNYYAPVIPGSEIRGMLRSVYETLTDSCMGVLNDDVYPVKRNVQAFQPALLHRIENGFELYDAENCIYRKGEKDRWEKLYETEKLKEGTKVYFVKRSRMSADGKRKISPITEYCSIDQNDSKLAVSNARGSKECGYLIKGMSDQTVGKKHNCHIFVKGGSQARAKLNKNDIRRLEDVIKSYQEQPGAEDSYKEYGKQLENFVKNKNNAEEYFPVYYSQNPAKNSSYYLAPACFTKEVAGYSVGDLAGGLKPCQKKVSTCPACSLFGMTGSDNENSISSRIRVADATVETFQERRNSLTKEEVSKVFDPIIVMEALGSPKISNTDFYLEKPENADFWTYDYYIRQGKPYSYQATLRGRKFYWHQADKKLPLNVEKTKLNKTVRPVKSNTTFVAKVYFEKISNKQLKQLLWILNGGTEEEQKEKGTIAYKIGNGKPLGLGSVKLEVKRVTERAVRLEQNSISYDTNSTLPEINSYLEVGFSKQIKSDFFTISSLTATKDKLVSYPVTEAQIGKPMIEGFQWFVKNHSVYNRINPEKPMMITKRIDMKIHSELPKIDGAAALDTNPQRNSSVGNNYNSAMGGSSTSSGEVVGYGESKSGEAVFLKIRLSGNEIMAHFSHIKNKIISKGNLKNEIKIGTRVSVKSLGLDQNNKEKWEVNVLK